MATTPATTPAAFAADAGSQPAVLVTRPAQDARHWVQQLQAAGVAAQALPLIDIAPTLEARDVQALQLAWQTLDSYAACLFVSGHAVDYFFKQKERLAHELRGSLAINNVADAAGDPWPSQLRFMAPGPGTAAALVAQGVRPAQIDAPLADAAQFDSEALWRVVGQRDWHGSRVLVVRGTNGTNDANDANDVSDVRADYASALPVGSTAFSGRDWIARQWQAAGATVEFVSVYERRAPCLSPQQLERARAASMDGSVWLFSSSEAVANLVRQPALSAVNWRGARAVATHPRIASSARAAGWGVVVESRPALKDILASLRSIESEQP